MDGEGDVDNDNRILLLERALARRVVVIVRLKSVAPLIDVAQALADGGIRALEFTLTTPCALDAIAACRARLGDGVVVGAGTVLDGTQARRCLDAGAQFLVSPGFDVEVVTAGRAGGALAMPGAMTPTEIVVAWRAGADVVKVFPARALGPTYISDVLAPLPHILLMPTGGVDETNAAAYLRAGAVAVAAGGNLVDAQPSPVQTGQRSHSAPVPSSTRPIVELQVVLAVASVRECVIDPLYNEGEFGEGCMVSGLHHLPQHHVRRRESGRRGISLCPSPLRVE